MVQLQTQIESQIECSEINECTMHLWFSIVYLWSIYGNQ